MSLRKSPTQTPAMLAANRANARKSTGPRTPEGKARVTLNALKHGRYAERLAETLEAAGDRTGQELYTRLRREIAAVFEARGPRELQEAERVAVLVWCMARTAGILGRKPESTLLSVGSVPPSLSLSPFRIKDFWSGRGLVYWVQRKRYWTKRRLIEALTRERRVEASRLNVAFESQLRRRAFRLGAPGFWEQLEYGLDEHGDPNPGLAAA